MINLIAVNELRSAHIQHSSVGRNQPIIRPLQKYHMSTSMRAQLRQLRPSLLYIDRIEFFPSNFPWDEDAIISIIMCPLHRQHQSIDQFNSMLFTKYTVNMRRISVCACHDISKVINVYRNCCAIFSLFYIYYHDEGYGAIE